MLPLSPAETQPTIIAKITTVHLWTSFMKFAAVLIVRSMAMSDAMDAKSGPSPSSQHKTAMAVCTTLLTPLHWLFAPKKVHVYVLLKRWRLLVLLARDVATMAT